MATIRNRGDKTFVEKAKNLDAFRKVPEEYTYPTEIGGTLSILSRLLIIFLIYTEVKHWYQDAKLIFTFKPDFGVNNKVSLQVDITVATPCIGLSGVDLIDDVQQDIFSYGTLKREGTWWELSPEQKMYFDHMRNINNILREEYHSLSNVIFKDIILKSGMTVHRTTPERTELPKRPYDACRLHGTLKINKVSGVLHIQSGDHFSFDASDFWHGSSLRGVPVNFSHRINKLSFGDFSSRIVQPLEGDERNVLTESTVIQYFIEIVPTEIHNFFTTINTYQYSVKENFRNVDSSKNSYGHSGIYFKYDWSALKVIIRPDRDNFIQLVIRLCSVISGIIVISGLINSMIQFVHKSVVKYFASYVFEQSSLVSTHPKETVTNVPITKVLSGSSSRLLPPTIPNPVVHQTATNDLLLNANEMDGNSILVKAIPQTP